MNACGCSPTRLIPAGAGQTGRTRGGPKWRWAHPRRCGADDRPEVKPHADGGSSPQVRGRLMVQDYAGGNSGLIPAGAGQTPLTLGQKGDTAAHPRRCGADSSTTSPPVNWTGSSPQVRGRPAMNACGCSPTRLIPAGAGQTGRTRGGPKWRWAHPRRCGADDRPEVKPHADGGSSPQVRGRLMVQDYAGGNSGLIPAGAGQTVAWISSRRRSRAHPRRCGADVPYAAPIHWGWGSSPQVRGRRWR